MDVVFMQPTHQTLFKMRKRCMAGMAFQIFAACGVRSMIVHLSLEKA